jgi:transposase
MARTEPELTDAQWAALEPLLPPRRPATGRPNNDHRRVVEAMVWLARTGSPWRDLPGEYGSWKTVASRFYRWRQQGIFERLLAEVHDRVAQVGVTTPAPSVRLTRPVAPFRSRSGRRW